jgi:hypothetical protein
MVTRLQGQGAGAVPTIDLTDAEMAAVTAAIRRTLEDNHYPHAPRLVPLDTALAKFDEATAAEADLRTEADAHPKAPPAT